MPLLFGEVCPRALAAQESSPATGSGLRGLYRAVRPGGHRSAAVPKERADPLPSLPEPGKRARTDFDRGIDLPRRSPTGPHALRRRTSAGSTAPRTAQEADTRKVLPIPTTIRPQPQRRPGGPLSRPEKPISDQKSAGHVPTVPSPAPAGEPTRAGFPTTLEPTTKGGYRYRPPQFYQGIYITSSVARTPRLYRRLLKQAASNRVNTLVVDVQPKLPPIEFIRLAREAGFYLVARVVVFPGGLKEYPPRADRIHRTFGIAEQAARTGFMEVQLDYIRFADRIRGQRSLALSLRKRYRLIEGILKMATDRLRPHGVRVGADVFGRIAFNNDDIIGQKVELFAAHLDTIYPMLYPSHFYGEPHRIRNPYRTVLLGNRNTVERTQGHSRIIAYIQGFKMSVGPSGLSYEDYIRKQIAAAEDSGGAGYIVWNARNRYGPFFRALAKHRRLREKAGLTHQGDAQKP